MPLISKFWAFNIVVSAISGSVISKVKTMISMVNIGIQYRGFLVTYDIVGLSDSVVPISVYKDIVVRPTIS